MTLLARSIRTVSGIAIIAMGLGLAPTRTTADSAPPSSVRIPNLRLPEFNDPSLDAVAGCVNFNDSNLRGWAACAAGPNVTITTQPNGQGGAGDRYLRTDDDSGASLLCGGPEFIGDFSGSCWVLQFDMRIINDTNGNGLVSPILVLVQGGISASFQFAANTWISADSGPNPGWSTFTVPIGPVGGGGNLPSNAFGQWTVTPPGAANWNTLLANVTAMQFRVDIGPASNELIGYDNFCLSQGVCFCGDPTDPGLVAWYGFNIPGVLGQENSVHGLHADEIAVGVAKGLCQGGLRFLPNNNVQEFAVDDHNLLDITGAMTGMAWVRPWGPQSTDNNPGCAEGTIFTKGGNYWFQLGHNNDQLVFQNDGGSPGGYAATPATLPLGEWTHVAFVRSAGANNVKFYVNGAQVGPPAGYALTVGPSANSSPLMLGNYGFGNSPSDCELNGDLDEVRLYSRVLTDAEINDIYNCDCPDDQGPCPAITSLTINTGYDQWAQGIKTIGSADNEWTVVSDPVASTTEPRPAYVIAQYPTGWHDPLDDSQWISSYPDANDETDNHYVFEYNFCLLNTTGASLSMMLLADDRASVLLNGTLIGSTPAVGFINPTTINTTTGFVAGQNRLRIDVENTNNVAMGLNVAATIFGNVPEYAYCCSDSTNGLTGKVWNDLNGNGARENGEPPLAGRTVTLSNGQTRITDNLGNYYFLGLPSGNYTINQTPFSGWIKTAPPSGSYSLFLPPADFIGNFDFGNQIVPVANCDLPTVPMGPLAKGKKRFHLAEVSSCCIPASADTLRFGATYWAADSLRWEAITDSQWTFDSGVGSSINMGANPGKPIGYHQTMNGWYGLDLSGGFNPGYFQRSGQCPINGFQSMTAGLTLVDANALCYASGAGYGNDWNMTIERTYAVDGECQSLTFKYRVTAEDGSDFLCVAIDTTGNGTQPDLSLMAYTGTTPGGYATATLALTPGISMRSDAGPVTIRFVARSDGQYSDQDGGFNAPCALAVIDDITVGMDVSNFELGPNGWTQSSSTALSGAVGDFSNLAHIAEVEPIASLCPCGLADSVLVFFDTLDGHPLDQDNLAVSPWIDLKGAGMVGRSGKAIFYSVYGVMPLANYVFAQFAVRSYPEQCATTGLIKLGGFRRTRNAIYFGDTPFCTREATSCAQDISCESSPTAEQVQIAVGVINLCRYELPSVACSGITNQSPYFDNISLGVYGSAACALVRIKPEGRLQDAFATDGTFNPASTGRADINDIRGDGVVRIGMSLGDTLVACGDGGNTEVRLVFRVRSGPFTSPASLAVRSARWATEPTLNARYGGTWYSARMDTAETAGIVHPGCWMDTFHEFDPGFAATDRTPDPLDPGELENEILPDHVFTPGSRVDYFITSRYIPPDPRNPGGTAWCQDPDTSGANFLELEILPSSMAADTTWNCTLWVNHHAEPCENDYLIEYNGLANSLGYGSNNAENVRFDRYDVQQPTSFQLSFGRPLQCKSGCSILQVFMYRNLAWHSGRNSSGQFINEDAAIISPFLLHRAVGNNAFWGTGDNLVRNMNEGGPFTKNFLNNVAGTLYSCNTARLPNCPSGTPVNTTYCLPTTAVPGSHFISTIVPRVRGNGCPDEASLDVLQTNPAVSTARGNLNYLKGVQTVPFASVSNFNTVDVTFHTVLDGMGVARLRTNPGTSGAGCNDVGASYARTDNVLDWFGATLLCRTRASISGVELPTLPVAVAPTAFLLGAAYPSPMRGTVRIPFDAGSSPGHLRLDVFDVSGRLVSTIFNGEALPGPHEVTWDGRTLQGAPAANGLYFYRLTDQESVQTRKLLLMK